MKWLMILILLFSQILSASPTCRKVYSEPISAKDYALSLGIAEKQDLISRFIFKRYLQKWQKNKIYSPESFDRTIQKSYVLLNQLKKRQGLIDNRDRDFHSRPEEVVSWVEQELMKTGLKGYMLITPQNQTRLAKTQNQLTRIFNSRFMKILWSLSTQTLPERKDRPLPADLMAKIAMDGLDPHFVEATKAFQLTKQNRIETYRQLRRVFGSMMLMVSAMISFHQLEQSDQAQKTQAEVTREESEKQYNEMEKGLDALEAAIDAI